MAISPSHPPYAMAVRNSPGWVYGLVFVLCMLIILIAFLYFLGHGYFLVHVPQINLKLPDLRLTS